MHAINSFYRKSKGMDFTFPLNFFFPPTENDDYGNGTGEVAGCGGAVVGYVTICTVVRISTASC